MRKIFIFIIVFLVFFNVFSFDCYATSYDVVDTSQKVYDIYDSFNNDFLFRLYNLSIGSVANKYYYNQIVSYLRSSDYSYYITYYNWTGINFVNSFNFNTTSMYVNFYRKNNLSTSFSQYNNWALIDGVQIRELSSSSPVVSFQLVSDDVIETSYSNTTFYLPFQLINYYPDSTTSFAQAYANNDSTILQQIANQCSRSAAATEKIQEILEDTTVSDSSYNQSSVTIPDSSSSDLSSTFTALKNVFLNSSDVDIVLPIPFVNNSITIDCDFVRDMLVSNGGSFIVSIVELGYYFILSVFIVKDVNRYLTKLKNGSIADSNESNIKAEIL